MYNRLIVSANILLVIILLEHLIFRSLKFDCNLF